MSSTIEQAPFIESFLAHRTGLFYCDTEHVTTHFSLDPSTGGEPVFESGQLLFQQISSRQEHSMKLKTLFLATPRVPWDLMDFLRIFRVFTSKNVEGTLQLRPFCFNHYLSGESDFGISSLSDSDITKVFDLFAEKGIPRNQVLILDKAFCRAYEEKKKTLSREEITWINSKVVNGGAPMPDLSKTQCLILEENDQLTDSNSASFYTAIEQRLPELTHLLIRSEYIDSQMMSGLSTMIQQRPLNKMLRFDFGTSTDSSKAEKGTMVLNMPNLLCFKECDPTLGIDFSQSTLPQLRYLSTDTILQTMPGSHLPKLKTLDLYYAVNPDHPIDLAPHISDELASHLRSVNFGGLQVNDIPQTESLNPTRWQNLEFVRAQSGLLLSQVGRTASQIEEIDATDDLIDYPTRDPDPDRHFHPCTAKSIRIRTGCDGEYYDFLRATEYLDLSNLSVSAEDEAQELDILCRLIEHTPETAEISLSGSIYPDGFTEKELSRLQTALAGRATVKWDLWPLKSTGTRATNPLDFSPDSSTPLKARYVFQTASGALIHPRLHLQNYAKLDSPGRIQRFTIPDSEWIVIDLPRLKPLDTENPYLGRVKTCLFPSKLEVLPNLPAGQITSINLPEHTHLLYHPKTNQYAVKVSPEGRFQAVQMEWTQTSSAAETKQCYLSKQLMTSINPTDRDTLSSSIIFEIANKNLILRPHLHIEYLKTQSPLVLATFFGQWIKGFHPTDAKTSAEDLAFHDHLNLMIQRRSGRCSERATLFIALMQTFRPELKCFYLSNDIHAMAGVVIEGITHIFDLGGAPAQLEIQPLPEPLTFAELTDDMADELPPKEKPQIPADTLAARLLCEKILLQQSQPPLSSLEPSAFAFNTEMPSGGRPKNLCLEVQKAEWISPVVQAIQRAGETSAYIFTAPSLLALSGTTYDLTTLKPKASPFQEFLSYVGEKPRVLILPSPILTKAQGPSSYYPLLDTEREMNGLTVPPDVTLLVVIDERNHRNQREDFDSRFEHLSLDPTLSFDGMAEATKVTKKYPPLPAFITSQEAVLSSPALSQIRYLDKINFKKLELHEEITTSGLVRIDGILDSPTPVSFWIPQDLLPHQWEKLQVLKASGRLIGQIYVPESLESPYVEKAPFFTPEPRPILLESADWAMFEEALKEEVSPGAAPQAITYLKKSLTPGDIPPESLVLALPRLGNPFVRYLPQDGGSFIAEFTELFARLQQASTDPSPLNIILHGPLSVSLQSQLHELSHGQAVIAGRPLKLGSRTRLTIIETADSPSQEISAMTDSEEKSSPCRIIEGRALRQNDVPAEFRFKLWLQNFGKEGGENRLTLSAFDLAKNSFLQDIVRSLIASQKFMFEGKIYSLGSNAIEVIGVQLPKEVTILAQAFSVYQRVAVEPAVAPIFPETSPDALRARIADWKHPTFCLSLSRAEFLEKVDYFLSLKSNSHPLFLVEGASGIGKSALLRTYLSKKYPEKLRIITPDPRFLDSLSEANCGGQIVLIDELNTFSKHELEALEALIQNQPNVKIFATQNPIAFSGRKKLSEGLLQHAVLAPLPNYTQEELAELARFQGLADERAESIAAGFTALRERRGWTPRDFFKLIKSLNQPSATSAPQEAFAFALNAKKTARREASTPHSKLGKIRP